jgi:hypothetical protein
LEAAGFVESDEGPALAVGRLAPPTGSLSGELAVLRARRHASPRGGRRARKVYRITDTGRERFAALLTGGGVDDARTFGLRVAFARHLAPQARLTLLERRRSVLDQRLSEVRRAMGGAALDSYAQSVVEHTADGIEQDIRWLDRLLAAERAPASDRSNAAQTAGEGGNT